MPQFQSLGDTYKRERRWRRLAPIQNRQANPARHAGCQRALHVARIVPSRQRCLRHYAHCIPAAYGFQGTQQLRAAITHIRGQPRLIEQAYHQFSGAGLRQRERVAAQILEAHVFAGCQPVIGRQQRHHLILEHREGIEALLLQHYKTNINPALVKPMDHLPVGPLVHMHFDAWVFQAKTAEDLRQQVGRGGRAE